MTKKKNKGFTLLEILLVIAAIGILAAIVLVAINPNRQIAQARNTVRQADINTIQKAVEQYLIEKGSYPNGITNTYKEICNTGSNNNTQGTVSSECIDLRELVPDYIASIPVNPSTSTHSGYYAWINDINNKVAVLAGKGENGKVIGINHLKENIVTDGLVLHLDAGNPASYPGTGNTWFDLSGNNNNGTLVNGVGYNPTNGGALSFDGVDDTITILESPSTNITSNTITFGGWVYPTISNRYQHIIVKNIGNSRQYGMWLSVNGTSQIFRSVNGVVTQGNVTLSSPWVVNTWNHIILVYNGSTIKIYLNSNEVYSQNASGNIVNISSTVNIGGELSQSFQFNGNISQVSIYNRALTPEEIQQNFNATRGRFGL